MANALNNLTVAGAGGNEVTKLDAERGKAAEGGAAFYLSEVRAEQ